MLRSCPILSKKSFCLEFLRKVLRNIFMSINANFLTIKKGLMI